jgi:outer membrane protein OmpA-like peptidoglycan-associated protein
MAFAALIALGSLPALAQGNPSADSIINALKPTGALQTGTRGIRPAAPSAPAAAPDPASQQAAARAPVAPVSPATQQPAIQQPASQQPIAAAARPMAPPPAAAAPSVNLTVQFMTGSAELTPDAMRTLDELGRALSSATLAAFRFRIEGHTDTVGSSEINMTLSQMRAAKVAEYLETKFGVSAARLEPVGRGSQAPLIRTADQVNEPRNRRVQVINLGS